jgi:hypothetical protein
MGLTVATKCLSEQMTALKDFSYQLVTISLRLIAEVLGLGLPVERHEINLTQQHLLAVVRLSDLDLVAFLDALAQQQPEQALKLLHGGQDA